MSAFLKILDQILHRLLPKLEVSAGPETFLAATLRGVVQGDKGWLKIGNRIVPLESGPDGLSARFLTRPGPKLVIAWLAPARGATARPVAARLVRISSQRPATSSRVTVIVPCYNHAAYLPRRLASIYGQTRQPDEIILLDDASTDDSAAILARQASEDPMPGRTRFLPNSRNSGGPFAQWARGLRAATGDYVWIAESDDWCDADFLERILPAFGDPAVQLAQGLPAFVDADGAPADQSLDRMMRGLPIARRWRRSGVMPAHQAVNSGLAARNLVPNASAVVFRRPSSGLALLEDPDWATLRICGDWMFYLHLLRGGKIAFVREARSYYRVHAASTSRLAQRELRYLNEHAAVARVLAATYAVRPEMDARRLALLERQHARRHPDAPFPAGIAVPPAPSEPRRPAVLVALHSSARGGAESFAVRLAVALRALGCAVTLLDIAPAGGEPLARPADLPLVHAPNAGPRELARLLIDFGVEWISTHHALADLALARARARLPRASRPLLFCTHHGYYHLDAGLLFSRRRLFVAQVDLWIHVATRGREPLELAGIVPPGRALKLPAAAPVAVAPPVPRAALDLPPEAFVVCVASRALPEKGWRESIAAVRLAREKTGADIRLILAGAGPMHDQLRSEGAPAFVRLLGHRSDIPSLFAACDLGLLATTYAGESCPLCVVECLAAGRPVVVTSVGDTPSMLTAPDGTIAGALVHRGESFVPDLAAAVATLATDADAYRLAASVARVCAERHDIDKVAASYLAAYREHMSAGAAGAVRTCVGPQTAG